MPDPLEVNIRAPYEDAIVAICGLVEKAMDGQPPEVRADLWRMFVEDVKGWRAFWQAFGDFFKPKVRSGG